MGPGRQPKVRCATCGTGLCCTKVQDLDVVLGGTTILENVNLHIHCGELTAIIGANGAGKSTLLKALVGEVQHGGSISYLDEKDLHTNKPLMGYVPQKLEIDGTSPTSVYDLFAAALSNRPVWLSHSPKVREEARKGLAGVRGEHLLDRRLGALSGGEVQRVLLALALQPVPDLLLLDEPVSGIDQEGLKMFYAMVSAIREEYDLSIILVSHDLDMVARYADRVVFLENRTVQAVGPPQEVFGNPAVVERFGMGWVRDFAAGGGPDADAL
ncbi:metal ABC transporter ATP-binding protein [Anaerotalea alkaliphila]|uniref:Metal ABC transporter ATP-binding protein n=1 Tax=Anaerotalea alkaliphila TaxID=2662126 RepID=A0A7X5KM02_9FIRM|nr:metal ABC transporter ATP-binding protein [Anaerotalea alkaliphila]NDL66449.1 metal ABC transporter ATP-binding protein [Anaerotalea alkaliphila]